MRGIARAGTLKRFNIVRGPGLLVVEIPGFGRRVLGAFLFFLVALPLALTWGLRAKGLIAVQLLSQTWVAGVVSLILRKPFIALATISGADSEVNYVQQSRTARLRIALLRRASALVAQTESMADEMRQIVEPERVKVVPNPARAVQAPSLTGQRSVMYSGRLSAFKGLDLLLAAWGDVMKRVPDAHLYLVGEGGGYRSVEAELRATARAADLEESITFTGWVDDIETYLTSCDVFVLPSRTEGMSNSLVEACVWGRVIVASDIPQNIAVIGADHELLFPDGDSRALAEALVQALTDDAKRGRAREQAEMRSKAFSVERSTQDLERALLGSGS